MGASRISCHLCLAALVALLCLNAAQGATAQHRDAHNQLLASMRANPLAHFSEWVAAHGKAYAQDAAEKARRFKIWLENLEYVIEYNARHTSHWLGMNSLADLTHEEYKSSKLGGFDAAQFAKRKSSNRLATPFKYKDVDVDALPKAVDWRAKNAVTPVKNQMQCGSCWAFSTTGAIEGVNAIVTKELVSLSEQELVDCDRDEDQGCNGGLMDNAFQWIIKNKGLDTEEEYPYTAMNGLCNERLRKRRVVTIDSYEDVPENDEASLKKAAAHQPVSVAIEADQKAFQLYAGGVFSDESCGTSLDHGVLLVGYGVDEATGHTYYIVKNSWGPEWGEGGYIRMKAGAAIKEGLCGIAMVASYPLKNGPNPPKPGPDPGPEPGPHPGPKPSPTPVDCDETSQCPAGTTCCCVTNFLNLCLQWGCCPIEGAICCEDKQHCCPPSLPVCDTDSGRCLPGPGQMFGSQPWLTKQAATRDWGKIAGWFMRGGMRSEAQPKCSKHSQAQEVMATA